MGYTIQTGDEARRGRVRAWLAGLDLVTADTAERIVTAWASAWESSPYAALEDMPYSTMAPDYRLMDHVNDVTLAGLDLARRAEDRWGEGFDPEVLVPILVLHDVDKPLMYVRQGDTVRGSPLSRELPHGVPGAMLLRDLGFPHAVVSVVATHASNAPFHGAGREAWVLHYADFFSTDHALRLAGTQPFYQRHWR